MKDLREHAKRLAKYLEGKTNDWVVIESHFEEIRNEALEEAAELVSYAAEQSRKFGAYNQEDLQLLAGDIRTHALAATAPEDKWS